MNRLATILLGLGALVTLGCAEGPLHRLGHLNPYVVDRWEVENEYALSLHTKREQIGRLAKAAAGKGDNAAEAVKRLGNIVVNEELPLARIEAANGLGKSKSVAALPALQMGLKDPESEVRIAVCHGLGEIPSPDAIGPLQEVIGSDTDDNVRLAAARALANFRDPRAAEALALALDDNSPALQYRAVASLQEITGQDFDGDVDQWRRYVQGGVTIDEDGPSWAERLGNLWR